MGNCYLASLHHWGLQRTRLSGFFSFQNSCNLNNSLFQILAGSLILSVLAFLISFLHSILKLSVHSIFIVLKLFKQKTIYRHCWKHAETNKINVTNISMITLFKNSSFFKMSTFWAIQVLTTFLTILGPKWTALFITPVSSQGSNYVCITF